MPKYFKPKPAHRLNEEQSNKRKKLFFDKRVKHVLNCETCDTPITLAEFKRNHGECDMCANNN